MIGNKRMRLLTEQNLINIHKNSMFCIKLIRTFVIFDHDQFLTSLISCFCYQYFEFFCYQVLYEPYQLHITSGKLEKGFVVCRPKATKLFTKPTGETGQGLIT
jgi:hypothetical protein